MNNEPITLDKLNVGYHGKIVSIDTDDVVLKNHILNMGLTQGVEVELIKSAPLGDPLEFRLRGYELTLRKDTASKIKISNIHKADNCPKIYKKLNEIEHSKIGESAHYKSLRKKIFKKSKIALALLGNQNSGKTTLFNKLTGLNQHVGNFPGVTTDKKEGLVNNDKNVTIVDLPGVYSLLPYSDDEKITRDFLLENKPDGIINIIDATNIERNLYLTVQLLELNIPMVIALNMMDEVKTNNGYIDINGLENMLGVPVVAISAQKEEGLDELVEHIVNVSRFDERPKKLDLCIDEDDKISSNVHNLIHYVISKIENNSKKAGVASRFAANQLIAGDKTTQNLLALENSELENIKTRIKAAENEINMDITSAVAASRYLFIEKLCGRFVFNPKNSNSFEFSSEIDKILTGKYTAIPAFFAVMASILYLTFGPLGTYLSDIFEKFINYIILSIDNLFNLYGLNHVFHSLITDGILNGVGSVLSFLPVIVILFFFLSVLEDTGYMARVAFIADNALRKIGLSGRSFVPMLIGFGCSVPAVMATRTLPSERDRKITIFLIPFMSCSAKLPIYALFTAAFFKQNQVLIVMSLYFLGILVGIIFAYIVKFFYKGKPAPFVMELPNYRFPTLRNVWRLIYIKSKDFVQKAFTVIFAATIIIWFLQTFDLKLNLAYNAQNSILAYVGNTLAPLFKPLGITDWRISCAFISGFLAKESVVSTLSVLMGGADKITNYFSSLNAYIFMVFSLLYTPCAAAVATVKRELGGMLALAVVALQCLIAWGVAFIVFKVLSHILALI